MAAVLKEVEKQLNLRAYEAIAPDTTTTHKKPGTKPSSAISVTKPTPTKQNNPGRQVINLSCAGHTTRPRTLSAPCQSTDAGKPKVRDSRLTAAAEKLSEEELALLEEDTFKPLDVYAIVRRIREQTVLSEDLFQ